MLSIRRKASFVAKRSWLSGPFNSFLTVYIYTYFSSSIVAIFNLLPHENREYVQVENIVSSYLYIPSSVTTIRSTDARFVQFVYSSPGTKIGSYVSELIHSCSNLSRPWARLKLIFGMTFSLISEYFPCLPLLHLYSMSELNVIRIFFLVLHLTFSPGTVSVLPFLAFLETSFLMLFIYFSVFQLLFINIQKILYPLLSLIQRFQVLY